VVWVVDGPGLNRVGRKVRIDRASGNAAFPGQKLYGGLRDLPRPFRSGSIEKFRCYFVENELQVGGPRLQDTPGFRSGTTAASAKVRFRSVGSDKIVGRIIPSLLFSSLVEAGGRLRSA